MQAYLVALLLAVGAVTVGRAISAVCAGAPAAAPAVGLAALLGLSTLAVRLPGKGVTAAVLFALAIIGAAVWLARRGARERPRAAAVITGAAAALITAAAAAAVGSIPFLSAGTVGVPGVSLNNDTAVHLLWAEGLLSADVSRLYPSNPGYPLGPHSLMASLASVTGADMDSVLTALVITVPVLTALVVLGALRHGVPIVLAIAASVCVAYTYLGGAWFGQAAFKEPLLALLLLGFALSLEPLLRPGHLARARAALPAGILAAAALLTYSYLALAWLGLTGVFLVGFTAASQGRPSRAQLGAAARAAVAPIAVGTGATIVFVAVELQRLWRYATAIGASPSGGIPTADLGNLAQPLQTSEALGIWPIADWRFPPAAGTFLLGGWKALALACVVGGGLYLLARREAALPAVLAAAGLVVALSSRGQSPYVTAKALAILSPFVALVIARALLVRPLRHSERSSPLYGARVVLAVAVLGAGAVTTAMVLRWGPVESPAQRDQLTALRPALGHGPTLLLVADDYAGWRLRGRPLAYVGSFPSPVTVATRPEKPYTYGQPLDWDSVTAATLDTFDYVVTTRGPYTSMAPPNFRLLAHTALYDAWQRTGPTTARETLEPAGAPFATLDCKKRAGRRLSQRDGVAAIRATAPVRVAENLPALTPGSAAPVTLSLPAGSWTLTMQYVSQIPVRLQIGKRVIGVPANTTRPGASWPVARVRSTGAPQQLLVIPERASRLTPSTIATSITSILALRDEPAREVPLRRACGRLIDWYRLTATG